MAYKPKHKLKYKTLDEILEFGINKGKTMQEMVDKESGWLSWAIDNVKGFKIGKEISEALEEKTKK